MLFTKEIGILPCHVYQRLNSVECMRKLSSFYIKCHFHTIFFCMISYDLAVLHFSALPTPS